MNPIGHVRRRIQARRYHDLVATSGLLDAPWYLKTYPDVGRSKIDPVTHYLRFGAREDRDPGPDFDTGEYRRLHADVNASHLNPLVHYLLHGRSEGRQAPPSVPRNATGRGELDMGSRQLRANGRSFETALTSPVLDSIQDGALHWSYRGVPCQKDPFDLALYTTLIGRLRPRTVLEIGTFKGGSALWFADVLHAHEIDGARIVTVDIKPAVQQLDPRVTYLTGSALSLDDVLPASMLETLPRPWLVIDDASHHERDITAVLSWIHPKLMSGDYLVVEDGMLRHFSDLHYDLYEDGPNRAVAAFLESHGEDYEIDEELCDWYGLNVTWNLNGWLRRR